MNERDYRVIQQLRELAVFSEPFADGITPDEIKAALIAQLAPYSHNRQALEAYAVVCMVPDAVSLGLIADHRWAMGLFAEALRIQREAIKNDRAAGLRCLSSHQQKIDDALSIYWSLYHLRRDVDELELPEFVHEALRVIGTIIEGLVKPLLHYLVHQGRLARGRHSTVREIAALTLGNLVGELMRRADDQVHFAIRGLRLNQWRNIAQHFSVRVNGQIIVCKYNDGQAQIVLSRSELREVLVDILSGYRALKVAYSVVFLDHVDDMRVEGMLARSELRPEASLIMLVSGLASQGFEVVEMQYTPEQTSLVVQDLSTLDPQHRRIHSTQFVIPLFFERPAQQVVVDYWERDGTPSLRTTASRALIERAQREGDWTLVAQESQFTNLKRSQ